MTHNDLKKGMRVKGPGLFGHGPMFMEVADNAKGIIRMIDVEESNGHYHEMGSKYIDEITHVEVDGEWEPLTLSPAHTKQMKNVRGIMGSFG